MNQILNEEQLDRLKRVEHARSIVLRKRPTQKEGE
jgi:hypothetical protein